MPIPEAQLTYKIISALYSVYNELGFGYQEKYYYRALRIKFEQLGLHVQEQLVAKLLFADKSIGRYFLDFLIDKSVVVELKVANEIYPRHIKQVLGYLEANKLPLGILAVYSTSGVKIKRIINSESASA